jgi:hypothetical protein
MFLRLILLIGLVVGALSAGKSIVIDLTKQEAYAYENGRLVMKGWVSTGKYGHRTPTGRFRILEKAERHVSSKYPKPYGGARMDYMMRITGSGIAMHLGFVPNYPASHGCIRMPNGFAQRMYAWAPVGTPVTIKGVAPIRVSRGFGSGSRVYSAMRGSDSNECLDDPLGVLNPRVCGKRASSSSKKRVATKKRKVYRKRVAHKRHYRKSRVKKSNNNPLAMLR